MAERRKPPTRTNNEMLRGRRLLLRVPEPSDVDLLYRWENDTTIWRVSNTITPYSRHQIEQFVLDNRGDIFATRQLRLMIDHHLITPSVSIGAIDLFDFDPLHRRAGVGILISKAYRSQGHAREALEIMLQYTFEVLKLHQVWCNISTHNANSIALFEKAGFEKCGMRSQWINSDDGWEDEFMYQLLNPND